MISAGRVLLMPKGEYNAIATYTLLDIVSYQGSSYIAKGTTTGNLPTDTTYWQLSAYGGVGASMAGNFATLETTEYASQGYSIGALLVDKDGKLCKVTDTILQNDEIIIDTNVEETTVEELLSEIYTYVDSLDAMDKKLVGQTAIITQTDLNDLKTVGEYYKVGTTFYVTNAPTGINETLTATFRLTVEGSFGNTELLNNKVTQTIVSPSGTTYKRGYDGSAWSTWIELATTAEIATAVTELSADVTGATSLADGAHGLVPKPFVADKDKFLKGDGTWANIATTDTPTYGSALPLTSGGAYTALAGKAPTSHASSSDTYGLGTTANYGHNKIIDDLTKTAATNGESLSAHMGNSLGKMIAPVQSDLSADKEYKIGEQFIYNGILYEATALISNGGTITIGGNCSTADDVTSQISKITNSNYTFGSNVDLSSYTTYQSPYTAPSDGYLNVSAGYQASNQATAYMLDTANSRIRVAQAYGDNNSAWAQTVFVKKGAKIYCTIAGPNAQCTFLPLATY